MAEAIIQVSQITVHRGTTTILEDVSWTVPARQHWVVLGVNGSGKTALLQVITGYLSPTAGKVTVFGKVHGTYDLRELRKSIGWVSSALQERIHGRDTALEVVISGKFASIGLWEQPNAEVLDQARAWLHFMGCEYIAPARYEILSQGEKQRVIIARALMSDPKLLIFDEPCSGLDPAARETFLEFIDKLGRQPDGPTLIYVTHHIEEITPVFTHIHIMQAGRTFIQGPKEEVIRAEMLRDAFGLNFKVTRYNDRYWTSIRAS